MSEVQAQRAKPDYGKRALPKRSPADKPGTFNVSVSTLSRRLFSILAIPHRGGPALRLRIATSARI
jgi:hypothetical protein